VTHSSHRRVEIIKACKFCIVSSFFSPLTEAQNPEFYHCYGSVEVPLPTHPSANQAVHPNIQPHKLSQGPKRTPLLQEFIWPIPRPAGRRCFEERPGKHHSEASSHGTCFKAEALPLEPDTRKSMGSDGMHQQVQRELADVVVMPLLIVFEMLW